MIKQANSFDEVRFLLAFTVLLAHTYVLASAGSLNWFTQYFDADFAVKGFFAISGYLVTKSFYSSNSIFEYFEKRIRRVYPAYIFVVFYCLIIGALVTSAPLVGFFTNPQTYKYLVANLSFLNFVEPNLPGVFVDNKIQAVNGSLWTIKIEMMLYLVVPILCWLYRILGNSYTYILALGFGIIWYIYFSNFFDHPLGTAIARQFPGQLPYFALGSILGFMRFNHISIAVICVSFLVYYSFFRGFLSGTFLELINMIAYPLIVISLAQTKLLSIGIGRFGDLSYGVYLFHFPTIQLLEHLGLYAFNPYIGFLMSIFATLFMAFISWHLVEKRVLKRSSHYVKSAEKSV